MSHLIVHRIAGFPAGTLLFATLGLLSACNGQISTAPNHYALGGTISGLTQSSLVLANKGRTVGVSAVSSSFSFGSDFAAGTSYAVTIQTQPTGQTCTVSNGSGMMGTANVGSVAIACGDKAYTLGGTVTGLTSSSLVLANGGDVLTVPVNAATFTMPTTVAFGTAFVVAVHTQPSGETCTITNGSGTMGTANDANVVVVCADRSYSLGGSVSGLGSSGLVLANGGDTITVPASATTFTLPTTVAYGSSYAVTVHTQPAGQACAVSAGTSTMPASNVTSVAVTCTSQPFSVGGSISGLTTSGLVLANGTDTRTVTLGATSFTMPAPVTFGSQYSVTVQTQPTGLTCSVSNGSGTIPAGNVTAVTVACADQTYSLGGAISGLTASGLVLANGTDTLTVSSGAISFTLPAAVPYGSPYNVTVHTQPATVTCTVGNGSGTMAAGAVTNVTVSCAVNTYTVGGSISGLTASGLVLANGSDVTPALGATATTFTMPTGVASGSTYNITVHTQPTGQVCTVGAGTGPVTTSNIASVTVSCTNSSTSFTTPGAATYVVPAGVTSLQVVASGGGGGATTGFAYHGGNGGIVTATISVTPGDVLTLFVGGGGGVGFATGGGGGSSNVNASTANRIIAGGGGGAGAGSGGAANGGDGGGNGTSSGANGEATNASFGHGGAAGVGGAGGSGVGTGGNGNGASGANGNGGAGGVGGYQNAGAGGIGSGGGTGGAGGNEAAGGGGGGGYGGGGGVGSGPPDDGGGGGGGSTGPTGSVFTVSTNGGATGAAGGSGSIVVTPM
jgi:RNase P/RNase MRP subunit p29